MKSKTSSCNSAIICNNLRRFWWVSVLYTIILFLIGPLWVLNKDVEQLLLRNAAVSLESFQNANLVIICFIAVIVGTMIFRYLQNSKSVTLLHAMPMSRGGLYISNFISGIILLFVPILFIALILFGIKEFTTIGTFILGVDLLKWLGLSLLLTTSIYSITVMVGMFTGSSIAQIIFTYILNLLPAAIALGINYLLIGVVYGFGEISSSAFRNLSNWMPITEIMDTKGLNEVWIINVIYITAAIVIGYFVYRSRNLENAGDVVSNRVLKPIFKYGVTFCTMGLGVIYIKRAFEIYKPNLLIYIGFALLGYVIAEMLLRKSFKIWDSYKGFIGYIGVLFIAAIAINADIIGYETKIPRLEDIEYAIIGDYIIDVGNLGDVENYEDRYRHRAVTILNEQEGIKKITDIHKKIIEDRKIQNNGTTSIIYKFKNGKFMERTYFINRYIDYQPELYEVYNLEEYKKESNLIFDIDVQTLVDLTITSSGANDENVRITNKEEMVKIVDMAKESILNTSYEDRAKYSPMYYIELKWDKEADTTFANYYPQPVKTYETITVEDKSRYDYETIYVYNCDTEILKYLDEMGYTAQIIKAEDIDSIRITSTRYRDESQEQVVKEIIDKATISEVISARGYLQYNENDKNADEKIYRISITKRSREYTLEGSFKASDEHFGKFIK